MKTVLIIALFLPCTLTLSQDMDSLRHQHDSVGKLNGAVLDSASNRLNIQIDAIQLKANRLIHPEVNIRQLTVRLKKRNLSFADSLQAVRELDSIKGSMERHIDSLRRLNIPVSRYQEKLDSVMSLSASSYIDQLETRQRTLTLNVNRPLRKFSEKLTEPVNSVEDNVNETMSLVNKTDGLAGNPLMGAEIPEGSIPTATLPTLLNNNSPLAAVPPSPSIDNPLAKIDSPLNGAPANGRPKEQITNVTELANNQVDKIRVNENVQLVSEKMDAASRVVDEAQDYGEDLKKITEGNIDEVKQIPDAIEEKVKNEIEQVKGETAEFDKYQDIVTKGKDPEAIKDMAKQEIVRYARNHFAGKQEVLQAAMDKLSKFKSKLPEARTLKEIPNRWTNQMKGKPFLERLVPGVSLQVQHGSTVLIDFNPNVGFRWTGRLSLGAGWNERVGFSKWNKTVPLEHIYGPRAYAAMVLGKGFSFKAELEKMNAFIPNFPASADGSREWIWSAFAGLKKEYRFMNRVKGNIQLLYNVYDDHDNSPYADKLNVRMGFELSLKKKSKGEKQNTN